MDTTWVVIIIMSYILVGMLLADTFVLNNYDTIWFSMLILWLPILIIFWILFMLLYATTLIYRLYRWIR